jgi:bacillithiol system protein YtxJ
MYICRCKYRIVMDWIVLREEATLQEIISKSATRPQVIFKHSIRCGISAVAKGRLDRATNPSEADFYYLDLINYRQISNKVSATANVYTTRVTWASA